MGGTLLSAMVLGHRCPALWGHSPASGHECKWWEGTHRKSPEAWLKEGVCAEAPPFSSASSSGGRKAGNCYLDCRQRKVVRPNSLERASGPYRFSQMGREVGEALLEAMSPHLSAPPPPPRECVYHPPLPQGLTVSVTKVPPTIVKASEGPVKLE